MTDETTAAELIEALKALPPDTVLRTEGGTCGVYCPAPDEIRIAKDGTKWVVIN